MSLSICSDWASLVGQSLHWGPLPTLDGAAELPARIEQRLIKLEISKEALALWASLIGVEDAPQGSA